MKIFQFIFIAEKSQVLVKRPNADSMQPYLPVYLKENVSKLSSTHKSVNPCNA